MDFERLKGGKRRIKVDSILAISLLALQYLISGDVLNPGFGFRIVVFKIDLLFEMITTFEWKVLQRSDSCQITPIARAIHLKHQLLAFSMQNVENGRLEHQS